jgi:hypothetical protein
MPPDLIVETKAHAAPDGFSGPGWVREQAPTLGLCFAIALYAALTLRFLRSSLIDTGTLTFPLDDTYIIMAVAKNFAFHGIWGPGLSGFQSAISCPGFVLILAAGYRLLGPSAWQPLALSLTFGLAAIFMAHSLLCDESPFTRFLALIAIVFFTPLHVMGILGMEHSLHLLLVLAFLKVFSAAVAKAESPSLGFLFLTSFMVSVRYESLFIVAGACLLLLFRRQARAAIWLGAAAAAPVVVFGAISLLHGCYWLPHSISLKGVSVEHASHSPIEFLRSRYHMFKSAPYLGSILLVMMILLTLRSVRADLRRQAMLVIVSVAIVLHVALARIGGVYRYEAYLVGAGIAAIACAISCISLRFMQNRIAISLCFIVAVVGTWRLYQRTADADNTIPLRSIAVYSQQIQMARFLHEFEPGVTIAANDVGAINYFADINCIDLVGLADKDVFWLKHRGAYTADALADLTARRQVKIAIVYDSWFSGTGPSNSYGPRLPLSWIRVQRWNTLYGRFLGDSTVSFYATSAAGAVSLNRALAQFDSSLPHGDRFGD